MLVILLLIVLLTCTGLVWMQGLWGAMITILNLIFSGLIATNYCFPLAATLERSFPRYGFFWDFLSLWLIFCLVFLVLWFVTGKISKYRVRFIAPVEMAGRSILAFAVGWLMVCFVLTSLHMAPLAEKPFFGSFQREVMSHDFMGSAPDQLWISLVDNCSQGSLSPVSEREFGSPSDLIQNYRIRRREFEQLYRDTGSFSISR